jgi:hypothetical protein
MRELLGGRMMASVFMREGDRVWVASFKDERGIWRQRRGTASKAETLRLARTLEDEARGKRVVAKAGSPLKSQSIERAIADYCLHLTECRKGSRQVDQAAARLKRVFDAARIHRLSEIDTDAIHEAVRSFGSQKGGRV